MTYEPHRSLFNLALVPKTVSTQVSRAPDALRLLAKLVDTAATCDRVKHSITRNGRDSDGSHGSHKGEESNGELHGESGILFV